MCDDHEYWQEQDIAREEAVWDNLRERRVPGTKIIDLTCDDEVCFHGMEPCPDLDDDSVTYWDPSMAYMEEVLNRAT